MTRNDSRADTAQDEAELDRMAGILRGKGYIVRKTIVPPLAIPDIAAYHPYVNDWAIYSPWFTDALIKDVIGELLERGERTLVSPDRLWTLMNSLLQTRDLNGEVWELGVYKGGTALLLRRMLERLSLRPGSGIVLRLFDTFGGMPATDKVRDVHSAGDFADTSLEAVRSLVGGESWIDYRQGIVPASFGGLDCCAIRFAHIDLDIYEAIHAACAFVYPRLVPGGMMVFDDYGFWSCPGARAAVDEFFVNKREAPFALPTGQALVAKLP